MYQEHPVGFAPGLGLHSEEIPYACQNHFNGYCGKNHAHQSLDRNQSTFFDKTSEGRGEQESRCGHRPCYQNGSKPVSLSARITAHEKKD